MFNADLGTMKCDDTDVLLVSVAMVNLIAVTTCLTRIPGSETPFEQLGDKLLEECTPESKAETFGELKQQMAKVLTVCLNRLQ